MAQGNFTENCSHGRGGSVERVPVHQNEVHVSFRRKIFAGNRNVLLLRQRSSGERVQTDRKRFPKPDRWYRSFCVKIVTIA